ncbi:MAG: DUF4352 domain-containing protein [Proteobacteria bacterium]|nr:DUF4352 domain-containing protein [Pseudomonadota bacterium]
MRKCSRLTAACLVAALSLGAFGCTGEPPEPPKAMGVASVAQNQAEISVVAFELTTPDFVDGHKQAMRPMENQGEVAIVRLRVKNSSDKPMTYKPLHFESPARGVQLSTNPDPKTGARAYFKSITFDATKGIHTTNQLTATVDIPPGGEILDDYLFENPVVTDAQLVVLVPGAVVGEVGRTFRFFVDNPPVRTAPPAPARLGEPVTIDGLTVSINSVTKAFAELVPRTAPSEPLRFAYAYTDKPVLVLTMTIRNDSNRPLSYEPSHTAETGGINLALAGGAALKRIKLAPNVIGRGQVTGIIQIGPGETKTDVYFFEVPASSSLLNLNLSGHIFGVRGMYRFLLDYAASEPESPDLHPYRAGDAVVVAEADPIED